MFRNLKILFFILLCISQNKVLSQDKNTKKDSTEVYSGIKEAAKRSKAGNLFQKAFFRSKRTRDRQVQQTPKDINKYDGKIIRNINITTLDPFGQSDTDTTVVPKNWGERTGNKLHLKTKRFAIKNLLLFRRNGIYDGFKIQESERIIRSQRFVSRVIIRPQEIAPESDSIDVSVRVLDAWSLLPRFAISSSKVTAGFNDRNILGTGQQLEYRFTNRFEDGRDGHDGTYTVPNILNTFISTRLNYRIDLDNNYSKSIAVERPFYSPLTKWAGGVVLGQDFRSDSLQAPDLRYEFQNFKYNTHDFWGAKAFNITSSNPKKERVTNFIASGRFLDIDYTESPTAEFDSIHFFSDEKLMLAGFGVNTREFIKDSYIFRNGNTEDVPIGKIYGITLGYQYKNKIWRPYAGAQASFGEYFDWGYLSANFEAGTFFHQSKTYQTSFAFEATYFTNLLEVGNWKIRQFIKPEMIIGINRAKSIGDQLTINENYGIQGFNEALYGKSKMVLTLQTQTYSPKEIIGFRINPFFNYAIAVLGNSESGLLQNKYYSKISLGLLISNDYLVFSSFQLSLSYYPSIPFEGDSAFKTNTFQTTDFGLPNFELAKPRIVEYR
ncbi:hypothetical protein GON26_07400 [Flavobacterium sp. GA093]|uniref:Uncharacterized protein n=1 Tax=Flavobacterium hydrocarbonoxydans TaxID=2683249 RepID=A0A6I4NJL6_9FLAO|nr:hypothetical protein [Flavobacterium hydrocarbonoxydans]MWB94183.1 hypothetical protein [Flavobacterium hydrocarbonoxydans]